MTVFAKIVFAMGLSALALSGCGDKNKGSAQAAPQATPQEAAQAAPAVQQESNRICYVTDFDTRGCKKGDTILFLPEKWGNEQLPVNFAAQNCDFSKQIAWTNGGVTCIFAGDKEVVEGAAEVTRISYSKLFEQVSSKPEGWKRFGSGNDLSYWRVVERSTGETMQEGDMVSFRDKTCKHDFDGTERPQANFVKSNSRIGKLTKEHWLYQMQAPYGSVIEVVGPATHYFMMPEKVVNKSSKKKSSKK